MDLNHSQNLYEQAKKLIPGGVNSPVRAIKPFPFYTACAHGSKLTDIDNNEYIDFCLAYGPKILGHSNSKVKQSIIDQLDNGWLYGTPTELEVKLAEKIINLYPSIDMVRFVSTGTEATMSALRVAKGFTGKNKFIKIEGGFHGAHDSVLIKAGSGATTLGKPDSLGVPEDFTKNTLQIPYNDIEALNQVIEKHGNDIAAFILEPVLGNIGPIIPEEGYLEEIRKITQENDIVLIFDEVITGFRMAMGGAQEFYKVTPDMTTLGKIIGGGTPIGVFGGKKEIMDMVSPSGGVYQAGTFSGSPISIAAGLTVLDILEKEKVQTRLNKTGDKLRATITDIISDLKLNYNVCGVSSMFKVFFGEKPSNYQDVLKCDKDGYLKFFFKMLNNGIFLPPSQFETNFLCTEHNQQDIDKLLSEYQRNLKN